MRNSTSPRFAAPIAAILLATLPTSIPIAAPRSEIPSFDAVNFAGDAIDHPYFPLHPGARYDYRATTVDGIETSQFEVTYETKPIDGVTATVVHDRVWLNGVLIEDTFDWFAQDKSGNVWYLGEDSKSYDAQGNFTGTQGSWETGVAGAQPGIVMLAHPEKGDSYVQELAPGVAEDQARVVSLGAVASVQVGSFSGALETLEWTPLEPGARERKIYARGVGLVLTEEKRSRVELIGVTGL